MKPKHLLLPLLLLITTLLALPTQAVVSETDSGIFYSVEGGVDAFMGCDRLVMDVKGNPYAKAYAEQYNIPTGFTSTFAFTLILLAVTTALLGGAAWVGYRMLLRRKEETKS